MPQAEHHLLAVGVVSGTQRAPAGCSLIRRSVPHRSSLFLLLLCQRMLLPCTAGFADPNCTQSTPSFYCGTTPGGVRCKYGLRVIGALCRPKAGDCDKEEYCGFNVNANPYDCPDDVFASSMQVCRAANGSFPAQLCTGTSPTCPGMCRLNGPAAGLIVLLLCVNLFGGMGHDGKIASRCKLDSP